MEYTDIELKNEKWRDVAGYDGMYQVSDLGRVRSKKYGYWRLLRPSKLKSGYLSVNLSKNGEEKTAYIHRLVAQTFIDNTDISKTIINHIDENKHNNKVSNIEWCDRQYNNTYNGIHLRRKTSKFNIIKKLYCTDLSVDDNIEILKANGIECCKSVLYKVRKELGLTKKCEPKIDKIRPLYNPDLTIRQNLDIFKANGFECSEKTVRNLRKDLGLTKKHKFRNELKYLYNPDLTIKQNIEIFKANGFECCRDTVVKLRKDLGLIKQDKEKQNRLMN